MKIQSMALTAVLFASLMGAQQSHAADETVSPYCKDDYYGESGELLPEITVVANSNDSFKQAISTAVTYVAGAMNSNGYFNGDVVASGIHYSFAAGGMTASVAATGAFIYHSRQYIPATKSGRPY